MGTNNSHIRSSTKISQIEYQKYHMAYKNILLDLEQKYLILNTKNIIWHTKIYYIEYQNIFQLKCQSIFQVVHQNISDCIPKYFNKT